MTASAADTVQAIAAFLAFVAAVWAVTISLRAYRNSYVPLIRVVPARVGEVAPKPVNLHGVILKNLGRGAAVAVVIVEKRGATANTLVGELDALEPLGELFGPEFREQKGRVGRAFVELTRPQCPGHRYRVLYQDTSSDWHETEFTVRADASGFEVRMSGHRHGEEIPAWVRERAQIVTA